MNYKLELEKLKKENLYREIKAIDKLEGKYLFMKEKKYLDFSSSNYLGLRDDERIVEAVKKALDTYGLGSIEVAKLRKEDHGKFTDNKKLQAYIYNTAKLQDFEVALVFDEWVKMPDYFSKVGTLTIQNNYMAGGTTVSFYAVKKENTDKLRNQ